MRDISGVVLLFLCVLSTCFSFQFSIQIEGQPVELIPAYDIGIAYFGPSSPPNHDPLKPLRLFLADDSSYQQACSFFHTNLTSDFAVLARRGTCYFGEKALYSQRAGASAVIVADLYPNTGVQGSVVSSTAIEAAQIPTVSLSVTRGAQLLAALAAGLNVTVYWPAAGPILPAERAALTSLYEGLLLNGPWTADPDWNSLASWDTLVCSFSLSLSPLGLSLSIQYNTIQSNSMTARRIRAGTGWQASHAQDSM